MAPKYLKTLEEFHEAIKGDVVIIDFTASWCGPCRMIGPVFEELAGKYEGKIACYKVDVDDNADAAGEAGIRAMPTFKVYKKGKQEEEMMGASQEKLKAIFEKHAA